VLSAPGVTGLDQVASSAERVLPRRRVDGRELRGEAYYPDLR